MDTRYEAGFGNEFATEAVAGALPRDQNAPQKPPLGLYVEELNGTAFTAPRGVNRSTWMYRIRPSVMHRPFVQVSIYGKYIGKSEEFAPGSASLHNRVSGHGPDAETYDRATGTELSPQYLDETMTFIVETQLPVRPTRAALETDLLERDYYLHWQGLKKNFHGETV